MIRGEDCSHGEGTGGATGGTVEDPAAGEAPPAEARAGTLN